MMPTTATTEESTSTSTGDGGSSGGGGGGKILLVTANLGSIFSQNAHAQLQAGWMNEFMKVVRTENPSFLSLHMQELGGKDFTKCMRQVQNFITTIQSECSKLGLTEGAAFLDQEIESVEEFTVRIYGTTDAREALGSLYLYKPGSTAIYDFNAQSFQTLKGVKIENSIKNLPNMERSRFPQNIFPEAKAARKGFTRTRWKHYDWVFDVTNLHLFHNASNLTDFNSPLKYPLVRKGALRFLLSNVLNHHHHYRPNHHHNSRPNHPSSNDDTNNHHSSSSSRSPTSFSSVLPPSIPTFFFGDFNFRLDITSFLQRYTKDADLTKASVAAVNSTNSSSSADEIGMVAGGQAVDTTPIEYLKKDSQQLVLRLGKKTFDHAEHDSLPSFWRDYLPDDKETKSFRELYECPISFPPSYPWTEELDVPNGLMHTRLPAWCDRVLMNQTAWQYVQQPSSRSGSSPSTKPTYGSIGLNTCMGDHKPVFLSFTVTNNKNNENDNKQPESNAVLSHSFSAGINLDDTSAGINLNDSSAGVSLDDATAGINLDDTSVGVNLPSPPPRFSSTSTDAPIATTTTTTNVQQIYHCYIQMDLNETLINNAVIKQYQRTREEQEYEFLVNQDEKDAAAADRLLLSKYDNESDRRLLSFVLSLRPTTTTKSNPPHFVDRTSSIDSDIDRTRVNSSNQQSDIVSLAEVGCTENVIGYNTDTTGRLINDDIPLFEYNQPITKRSFRSFAFEQQLNSTSTGGGGIFGGRGDVENCFFGGGEGGDQSFFHHEQNLNVYTVTIVADHPNRRYPYPQQQPTRHRSSDRHRGGGGGGGPPGARMRPKSVSNTPVNMPPNDGEDDDEFVTIIRLNDDTSVDVLDAGGDQKKIQSDDRFIDRREQQQRQQRSPMIKTSSGSRHASPPPTPQFLSSAAAAGMRRPATNEITSSPRLTSSRNNNSNKQERIIREHRSQSEEYSSLITISGESGQPEAVFAKPRSSIISSPQTAHPPGASTSKPLSTMLAAAASNATNKKDKNKKESTSAAGGGRSPSSKPPDQPSAMKPRLIPTSIRHQQQHQQQQQQQNPTVLNKKSQADLDVDNSLRKERERRAKLAQLLGQKDSGGGRSRLRNLANTKGNNNNNNRPTSWNPGLHDGPVPDWVIKRQSLSVHLTTLALIKSNRKRHRLI